MGFFLAALGFGVDGDSDELSNESSALSVETVVFLGLVAFAVVTFAAVVFAAVAFAVVFFGAAAFLEDPRLKMGARGKVFSSPSSESTTAFFFDVLLIGVFLTETGSLSLDLAEEAAAVLRFYNTK